MELIRADCERWSKLYGTLAAAFPPPHRHETADWNETAFVPYRAYRASERNGVRSLHRAVMLLQTPHPQLLHLQRAYRAHCRCRRG